MKQKKQESLEAKVLRFIKENQLIPGNHPLVVAVSGGPDSVCLLHALVNLRKELGINLHVAHLDHQLRGKESEGDALYVEQLAKQLGIPVTLGIRDVTSYRAKRHLSLEEAAREVRYTFLAEVAESIGSDSVAVGHTTDDQVETILMHLIRGTGPTGLRGLQPFSQLKLGRHNFNIIRPLLTVGRQETNDYCRTLGLEPRQDSSNLSLSPLRNKIRHQLVPLLAGYNPRITEALLRTSRLAGDDLASLSKESVRLDIGVSRKENGKVFFDKKEFLTLPVSVQRHILRESIQEILGSLKDIEARHIEQIIAAAGKPAGKTLSLPMGLVFTTEYGRFILSTKSTDVSLLPPIKGECALIIPGQTLCFGWRITASILKHGEMTKQENGFTAYLSLDEVGSHLLVRARQPGDSFQPLGMSQTRELAEFMIDSKIPRAQRSRIPIVCSTEHIVWVVGHRIDDRVKVTGNTGQVLRLIFDNLSE